MSLRSSVILGKLFNSLGPNLAFAFIKLVVVGRLEMVAQMHCLITITEHIDIISEYCTVKI